MFIAISTVPNDFLVAVFVASPVILLSLILTSTDGNGNQKLLALFIFLILLAAISFIFSFPFAAINFLVFANLILASLFHKKKQEEVVYQDKSDILSKLALILVLLGILLLIIGIGFLFIEISFILFNIYLQKNVPHFTLQAYPQATKEAMAFRRIFRRLFTLHTIVLINNFISLLIVSIFWVWADDIVFFLIFQGVLLSFLSFALIILMLVFMIRYSNAKNDIINYYNNVP